ncbi:GroES family chaperonin [Frankia sp. AgKG'84/4]|uniref:GroES family chaperonin n=1 Tax=Frankia sp. AgKG'84/4 TaxID=573490 RepID=UPI00200CC645|nr:co-chaperone GroES [Frankia sp. AgKG'84/4]MCL9796501.1 co-chaperone GroES [Frankia sp. AgKG'84/4]
MSVVAGGISGVSGAVGMDTRVGVDQTGGLPIRLLHDRVLVEPCEDAADRRSKAGIVIPATAHMGKRLSWADVVAVGTTVRTIQVGDRVLFDPEERAEVELHSTTYVLLRERDVHAVAAERLDDGLTGLYL